MRIPEAISGNLLRYVILEHDWNGIHYDLMLEDQGELKTWRLNNHLQSGLQHAISLPVHRLEYLTYEGAVSGNRGTVRRVQAGEYALIERSESQWQIRLQGTLSGVMTLTHANDVWLLDWQPSST